MSPSPAGAAVFAGAVLALLGAFPIAAAASGGLAAGGLAVGGADRARILPPAGARIEGYENIGYRLEIVGDELVVQTTLEPLVSTAAYQAPKAAPGDGVERLARALVVGSTRHYEAVSRILDWVARHVEYRLDRTAEQSAEAVLARRDGYCTGIARLTVALLEAAGIEAREVAGYVVNDGAMARASSGPGARTGGYHRWVEIRIPDRGWIFSDPLATHHYVPATYVRLAADDLDLGSGLEGLLLERQNDVVPIDLHPWAPAGVTARRNTARRRAATLQVELGPANARGVATLEGWKTRHRRILDGGRIVFVGLDPGDYRLRLELSGGRSVIRSVGLPDRIRKVLEIPLTASAARLMTVTPEFMAQP